MPAQHRVLSPQQWKAEVALHGFLLLILILFSYGWFGTFFQMEGRRYFAAHTEIELASRIHQQLVPPIHRTSGDIEVYGVSVPSGAVGGDLLDLVEADGAHCAYVADVAGHGVAAGVLMSMVKTAVRMAFSEKPPATTGLLEAVNNALAPLTETSGYATFAYVLVSDQRRVTYSVAAHLPILHFQKSNATIARHTVENFPVAMFPDVTFQTGVIDFQPGDILAIVTDGLTEVFDSHGKELGDTYIDDALVLKANRPLAEIAEAVFETARSFGKIADDQTLLLMRQSLATNPTGTRFAVGGIDPARRLP